jgi:alcohol dehydrogenase
LDSIHDDVVKEIKKYAPAGADLTVDALGSIATSKLAVESLCRLGRHVQVGLLPPAEVKDQATVPMHTVIGRELTIMGSHGMSAAHYPEMLAEIASGVLRPDTLVERTITLDEVPDALAQLGTNPLPGITIIKP